jgi:uncharacterized protein involved in type VI secretion and phage assembly
MSLEKVVANLINKIERRFYGKYRGIVVNNKDPEQLGRLKVKVPSVLGGNVVTGWSLPCVPYGGDVDQGFLFIPEVGAGVWVEFEEGDLEFPIWVGTFWSKPGGNSELPKPNKPDGSEESNVQDPTTSKIIKTKKQHTLQFEDADGKEMIVVVDGANGHVATLDSNGIKIVDGKNKHEITMDTNGIKTVDGQNKHEITLDSQGMNIQDGINKHKINLSNSGVNIETQSGAKIQLTPAGISVDAGPGVVEVKGSVIKLSASAALPVLRLTDQGIGNLGAPVVMGIGPGNPTVLA